MSVMLSIQQNTLVYIKKYLSHLLHIQYLIEQSINQTIRRAIKAQIVFNYIDTID